MTTWLKRLEINYPEIYKRLDFVRLSMNPNIRIKDVLDHPDKIWGWEYLSANSGIQLQDIINHLELPWGFFGTSQNPNMTIEFAIEYKDALAWEDITRNPGIKFKDILNHPELPWNEFEISWNPNVTINDILNHQWDSEEIEWNPEAICSNKNITLDFVIDYLGVDDIDWIGLSVNPAITLNDIITHPEYPWEDTISENPNMTIEFAIKFKDKLDWTTISSNQGITMDDIIDHPELPWNWSGISQNVNITPDFVMANFKYIDFNLLSAIPFGNSKKLTKKIVETTLGLSSVPTEYAHRRLPAHLVREIISHAYDTSAFSLHDMIQRIAPIIEYKPDLWMSANSE